MRHLVLVFLFCLPKMIISQSLDWAVVFDGEETQAIYGIKTDTEGNVFIAGRSQGITDFDPGPGELIVTTTEYGVIGFIIKLSPSGDLIWLKTFDGFEATFISSFDLDYQGNIIVTGAFIGTIDFDPGAEVYTMSNLYGNQFITKLDPDGNFLWAKQLEIFQTGNIRADAEGNIVLVGNFGDSTDIDPGLSIVNIVSNGNADAFVLKLDPAGNFIWGFGFGGEGSDMLSDVDFDADNNVHCVGSIKGTADVDPGPDTLNLSSQNVSSAAAIFMKYSSNGELVWAQSTFESSSGNGRGIAVDDNNNVFVSTSAGGMVDLDPSAGEYWLDGGVYSIFISKFDEIGNFLWSKSNPGSQNYTTQDLTSDSSGNVFLTSHSIGDMDLDPGAGEFIWNSAGGLDIFCLKLDASGNFMWGAAMGGPLNDFGSRLYPDSNGNIYATGILNSPIDLDPGFQEMNIENHSSDMYVQKFIPCNETFASIEVSACDSLVSPSGEHVWTSSGIYWDFLTNQAGCDSVISINLTINNNEINISQSVCDSFYWPATNLTYYSDGMYSTTLTNAAGCDSIVNLNLVINNNGSEQTKQACELYTWQLNDSTYFESGSYDVILMNTFGCDSVVTLNLTINDPSEYFESQSACDHYTWPVTGLTYDVGGLYQAVFSDQNGCDSTMTLELEMAYSSQGTQDEFDCVNYTWDATGLTYSSSGLYSTILTNSQGCDSLVTLNLLIGSSSEIQTEHACDNFTWDVNGITYEESGVYQSVFQNSLGCDSLVELQLYVHPSHYYSYEENTCDSYLWPVNNIVYTESGLYTINYPNEFGCDSIFQLDIEIRHSSEEIIETVTACNNYTWLLMGMTFYNDVVFSAQFINDVGCDSIITLDLDVISLTADITVNGSTLTCNDPGANYQWVDCSDNLSSIDLATNQSYTAIENGTYAVIVSDGICSEMSSCYNITYFGMFENGIDETFGVYPNPGDGEYTLVTDSKDALPFAVHDLFGRTVHQGITQGQITKLDLSELSNGTYVLKIQDRRIIVVKV